MSLFNIYYSNCQPQLHQPLKSMHSTTRPHSTTPDKLEWHSHLPPN